MTTTRCVHVVSSSSRNLNFTSSNFFIIKVFHHQIFSIQLIFDQWKQEQQIRFDESFCQRFHCFENSHQTMIIFHRVIYCSSNFIFFDIREQFIITCFDVCLLVSQKQFKWLNFKILWTCRNFANLIFSIHICIIRLLFVFINLMCYFIFDFFKSSVWIDVEYINWFW